MEKRIKFSVLCALLIIAMFGASVDAKRRLKFHFYLLDHVSGPGQTVYEVARSEITSTSNTSFGLIRMVDNIIVRTPDLDATPIGRLQGLISFADLYNLAPSVTLNVVFTSGTYNGSVLITAGKLPLLEETREVAILGGTGQFLGARGKVVTSTYLFNEPEGYNILEAFLYVVIDDISVSTDHEESDM